MIQLTNEHVVISKILWEWKMIRCRVKMGPFKKATQNSLKKKFGKPYSEPKAEPFPGDAAPGCNLAFEKLPGLTPKKANKKRKGEMGILWW